MIIIFGLFSFIFFFDALIKCNNNQSDNNLTTINSNFSFPLIKAVQGHQSEGDSKCVRCCVYIFWTVTERNGERL